MPNKSPEQEVLEGCKRRLSVWQDLEHVVIHFDDLSNAGRKMVRGHWIMNTKAGRPDLMAYVRVGKMCFIYAIECKAPEGGNWSSEQQIYANKFENLENVVYEVVRHPKQIDIMLEKLTNYSKTKLSNIEF